MTTSEWSTEDLLAGVGPPTDWRSIEPSEALELWAGLRAWVEWFRDRYALDHRVVPPCWYRHGALVDLLTALRDHHEYAFGELQPASAATEWQRVFRDLEPRLREWASRTGCARDQHRPDVVVDWPDDAAAWERHVADDQRRRAATRQSAEDGATP